MSTFRIAANPAEFNGNSITIRLFLGTRERLYDQTFEAAKLPEIQATVGAVHAALWTRGVDAAISCRCVMGRKPNGFDKWWTSSPLRYVRAKKAIQCVDCGEVGVATGHQECQYPQDHA